MSRTSEVALLSFCITFLWLGIKYLQNPNRRFVYKCKFLGIMSFSTDSNSCQQKMCKEAHVSAPLPFDCDTLPVHCYQGLTNFQ